MAAQQYCEDCTRKDQCEYTSVEGKLLRCLDKQTASGAKGKELPSAAAGA